MRRAAAVLLACHLTAALAADNGAGAFSTRIDPAPAGLPPSAPGIEILGAVRLATEAPDGTPVTGLSALGWDADEGLLYAVSDRGWLLHLRPSFAEDRLAGVDYVAGYRLQGPDGRPLRGRGIDAESLQLRRQDNGVPGDTELVVSFEQRPRIQRHAADGRYLGLIELPAAIASRDRFQDANRGLEALAEHPQYGLMVLPEGRLRGQTGDALTLFDLAGGGWPYPSALGSGYSPVAMESLGDGRLILLERYFISVFQPLAVRLRVLEPGPDAALAVSTLATLDGADGWLMDNFEGLARYCCERFFMVSDDNGQDFQQTLLVHFRLTELAGGE